jgi:hypothetical protein
VSGFGVASEEGRTLISAIQVDIDPVAQTVTTSPVERLGSYHFPVSDYYSVLAITGYGWTPNFWADIRLTHPYPGMNINGYDARVIGVLPAVTGQSMQYATLGVLANDSIVLEADGYTGLWDKGLTGNVNPFLAYFKSQPFRVWAGQGVTQETRRWQMDLAGFGGGPLSYILVVDVSTNFPNAPTPIVDNSAEPAEIVAATVGTGMTPLGGSASIDVTLLDWQGTGQPITCEIEAPALFTGKVALTYSGPHPTEPNQYIFSGTMNNTLLAPEGDYNFLVGAKDNGTSRYIYDQFVAHVGAGGGPGAWQLDANRGNFDMTVFTQYPAPGTDVCVIDSGIPDWDGVLLYDEFHQVVRADLDLTDGNFYGYGYLPWDLDATNPHPTPDDPMPAGRMDGANNGYVFRTWVDEHEGLGPDSYGNYQRCDSAIGYFFPLGGILENLIVSYMGPEDEKPRGADVWDEFDTGMQTYVLGSFWAGTVIMDDTSSYFITGFMGGYQSPYFDGTAFVPDWGLWRVNNPPMGEIVAMDASQDPAFPMQYWAYSGSLINTVAWYDKAAVAYLDEYAPAEGIILDIELIPLQNPPLQIDTNTQYNDWLAILLDNGEIHVIDPFQPGGLLIDTIDLSGLTGDAKYMDVADNSAEIWVTHTDGVVPYISVFTIQ